MNSLPVGTCSKLCLRLKEHIGRECDVASNPEFLKEGAAIDDFMKPDRIVIGTDSEEAEEIMRKLYKPFLLNGHPIIFMDIPSAEMTKYAANAMLATKISFMNDVANLCEILGADVNMVRKGIGSDGRIGPKFIYPGVGYGGSCFPKDVKALVRTAREHNYDMRILNAVEEVNFIPSSHFGDTAASPLHFGWTDREGTIETVSSNPNGVPDRARRSLRKLGYRERWRPIALCNRQLVRDTGNVSQSTMSCRRRPENAVRR